MHFQIQYMIVVLEEGYFPHPPFPRRNSFFPWKALNSRHPTTEMCAKVA